MRAALIALIALIVACGPDSDADGYRGRDCDDSDPKRSPGATEVCDGLDNDCDGQVDEDVAIVAYWDRDADGAGDPTLARRVCTLPEDGVEEGTDCNDLDPFSFPGGTEVCDGADNDCDGEIDEGTTTTFYVDADGDGHGNSTGTTADCFAEQGYAVANDDCDDAEPLAWTDAPEVCDGVDNDCDGSVDEDLLPVAMHVDADGDGFGDPDAFVDGCGPSAGTAANGWDCDDSDASLNLDTVEIAANAVDDDCDGYVDEYSFPDHYSTLNDAIDAAPDGGVVQVERGSHLVTVDLSGRDLTLAGEGCDLTTLYADNATTAVVIENGSLVDLTVAGGRAGIGGGIVVKGVVEIDRVCVEENYASQYGGGIAVLAEAALTLTDSRVDDNEAHWDGGGIWVGRAATLTALRSHFWRNRTWEDGGALTGHGATIDLEACTFVGNLSDDDGGALAIEASEYVQEKVQDITGFPEPDGTTSVFASIPAFGQGDLDLPALAASATNEPTVTNTPEPGTVVVSWVSGGAIKSMEDDGVGGFASGDGNPAGSWFVYETGEMLLDAGTDIPDAGTAITLAYNAGLVYPTPDGEDPHNPMPYLYLDQATFVGNGCGLDPAETAWGEAIYVNKGTGSESDPNSFLDRSIFVDHEGTRGNGVVRHLNDAIPSFGTLGFSGNATVDRDTSRTPYILSALRGDASFVSDDDLRLLPESAFVDGDASSVDVDGSVADLGAYGGPNAGPDALWSQTSDGDQDGILDGWEKHRGIRWWTDDSGEDPDGDGLDNLAEFAVDSDPLSADSDEDGVSDPDEILDADPNDARDHLPRAMPALPRYAQRHAEVTVSGSDSWDPNGDPLTYDWALSTPLSSLLTGVDDPAAPDATFTPDAEGLYTLTLTVSDGAGSASQTTTVTVLDGLVVPDDVPTLAEAVATVTPGEAVFLQPGTYAANLVPEWDLALVGLGAADEVVLDGSAAGPVLNLTGVDVVLAHLTVANGSNAARGGGIAALTSTLTAVDVIVRDNVTDSDGGGLYLDQTPFTADRLVVRDNRSIDDGGGLFTYMTDFTVVRGTFVDNTASEGGAAYLWGGNTRLHTFQDTLFQGNSARLGVGVYHRTSTATLRLEGCTFVDQRTTATNGNVDGVVFLNDGDGLLFSTIFAHNHTNYVLGAVVSSIDVLPMADLFFDNDGLLHTLAAFDTEEEVGDLAGTVFGDPAFVVFIDDGDADNDLLWLRPGSVAIDAGFPDHRDADGSRADIGIGGSTPHRWDRDDDGDGMSDGWELHFGLDPTTDDGGDDLDADGGTNLEEYVAATLPDRGDTDGDGALDGDDADPTDPADNRPTANAGPDALVPQETVTLDGSGSSDPNGEALSFSWSFVDTPNGSALTDSDLSGGDTATPSFVPDLRGMYLVGLVVDDGFSDSPMDVVQIDVYGELDVPDTYATLEDALAWQYYDEDTIVLAAGTHTGGVTIDRTVGIRGAGVDSTEILGVDSLSVFEVSDGAVLTLSDLTVTAGVALTGGGIDCFSSTLDVADAAFSGNAALDGGAVRLVDCDATFTDVDFVDNVAEDGGALFVTGTGSVDIVRGMWARNEVDGLGAAIFTQAEDLEITNALFVGNVADTGTLYQSGSTADSEVYHCDFVDNADAGWGDLQIEGEGSFTFAHNVVTGHNGYGLNLQSSVAYSGHHNAFGTNGKGSMNLLDQLSDDDLTWVDPGFAAYDAEAPWDSDFRLAADSVLIDAGSSNSTDPDGSRQDIGAFGGLNAPDDFDAWYVDSEGDGMPDVWETEHGLDPQAIDKNQDPDADGLVNKDEYAAGTDPQAADTDLDGVEDGSDPDPASVDALEVSAGPDEDGAVAVETELTGVVGFTPSALQWTIEEKPGRSSLEDGDLLDATTESVRFTPDTPGVYVLEITAGDGVQEASDTAVVTVPGDLMVPEDYASLALALEALVSGSSIEVGSGFWPANLDAAGKDVTIVGAGMSATVLDGSEVGPVLVAERGEAVELQDLSVAYGVDLYGGGIRVEDVQGAPSLVLTRVGLSFNRAVEGGGLYCKDASVEGTDVWATDNDAVRRGAGLWFQDCDASFTRLAAYGNVTEDGGGLSVTNGTLDITNAVFGWNEAEDGGALFIQGGAFVDLSFATIAGNTASDCGSALCVWDGDVAVSNSILAHNGGADSGEALEVPIGGSVTWGATYTLFWDNLPGDSANWANATAGTGNQAVDPLLVDAELGPTDTWVDGDLGLDAASPAVDAGDPAAGDDADSSAPDLGAYGGPQGAW